MIAEALAAGRRMAGVEEIARLLDCYGIAMPEWRRGRRPGGRRPGRGGAGGPGGAEGAGPGIVHKTELGAVRVGLAGAAEVSGPPREMDEALARRRRSSGRASSSRQMVEGGTELLVGVVNDPLFGPVLACGAGGTQAELLKDVAVRICPLSAREASEMIRSLAIFPLLTGFRGAAGADLAALEGVLAADRRDGRSPPRDRRARPQPRAGGPGRGDGRRFSDQGRRRPAAAPLAQHLEGRKLAAPCEPPG